MRQRAVTCPNSKCGRRFEEPVLLTDHSVALGNHYYACPYCFTRVYAHPHLHRNRLRPLVGLSVATIGSAILAWVGWITWYDMTAWGKDLLRILFDSRANEAMSLGLGLKVIHYLLIGVVLVLVGVGTVLQRGGEIGELRFSATAPEQLGVDT